MAECAAVPTDRDVSREPGLAGSWPLLLGTGQPAPGAAHDLLALVGAHPTGASRLRVTWWDTPDWRLYRAGLLLEHAVGPDGSTLGTLDRASGARSAPVPAPAAPQTARDLPLDLAGGGVAGLVGIRLVVPVVTVDVQRSTWDLRDDEDKTVARLVADEAVAPHGGLLQLAVHPLRGYPRETARLLRPLTQDGRVTPAATPLLEAVAGLVGLRPGYDPCRLDDLPLQPTTPTREGIVTVLQRLDSALDATLDGTLEGLDTEFLHDHRVAVRRTRSALKLFAPALPERQVAAWSGEFRWLGDVTTPVRDLDVFLLEVDSLAAGLPPEVRAELGPFRTHLEGRRQAAQVRLRRDLQSGRAAALRARWAAALDAGLAGDPPAGAPARLGDLATGRLAVAHRRVRRRGSAITTESPAQSLHDLRKRAKELRYVLELLGPVFPAGQMKELVRELKGLQDVLGLHQDLEVQAAAVRSFATEMAAAGPVPAATLLAMGQLAGDLERRMAEERLAFPQRWSQFSAAAAGLVPALTGGPR